MVQKGRKRNTCYLHRPYSKIVQTEEYIDKTKKKILLGWLRIVLLVCESKDKEQIVVKSSLVIK